MTQLPVFGWDGKTLVVPSCRGNIAIVLGFTEMRLSRHSVEHPWPGQVKAVVQQTLSLSLADSLALQLKRLKAGRDLLTDATPGLPADLDLPADPIHEALWSASSMLWGSPRPAVVVCGRVWPLEINGRTGRPQAEGCVTRGKLMEAFNAASAQQLTSRFERICNFAEHRLRPAVERLGARGGGAYRDREWRVKWLPSGGLVVEMDLGRFALQDAGGQWYVTPAAPSLVLSIAAERVVELANGRCPVDRLLSEIRMSPHFMHPYTSSSGEICLGGDRSWVARDIERDGLTVPSAMIVAAMRATAHVLRRGYYDADFTPHRKLSESNMHQTSAEQLMREGVAMYPYHRPRSVSLRAQEGELLS
ncbi:MAG: hypothetical protein H5T86_07165 [Armatimonadetes bacterium]|nr:hypothetical protein [Armatimonadota bacterium]